MWARHWGLQWFSPVSQGSRLPQVALLMGLFGLGAALPVVALAHVGRVTFVKMRGRLIQAGKTGRMILGEVMIAVAAMILCGVDKTVKCWLVIYSPT